MKPIILVLFFSIGLSFLIKTSLYSQLENNQDNRKSIEHSVGIVGGLTTGYGLAYRLKIYTFGFRTNFAPYSSKYSRSYIIGLTLTKDIKANEKTKLFLYLGNSYNHIILHPNATREWITYINTGIGIGMEFIILEQIGFEIMAGYGVYRRHGEVNLSAEAGFFYKF